MNPTSTILIVDDEETNLLLLENLLVPDYSVLFATNGAEALVSLQEHPEIEMVLLDVMMPEMDGFEVCRCMKSDEILREIPVLFITALNSVKDEEKALALGAEDFINKPFSPPIVLARVRNHLQLARARSLLKEENRQFRDVIDEQVDKVISQSEEIIAQKQKLLAVQSSVISTFMSIIELRSSETLKHLIRVQTYMFALADKLSESEQFKQALSSNDIYLITKSSSLHDIGKTLLPNSILVKPSALTDEERVVMESHCDKGRALILRAMSGLDGSSDSFVRYCVEIAYSHHENWDGSGYPQGLKGLDIPLSARMMAVIDSYDAMVSDLVYKEKFPHQQAVELIRAQSGYKFDPDIVEAFVDIESEFEAIALETGDI